MKQKHSNDPMHLLHIYFLAGFMSVPTISKPKFAFIYWPLLAFRRADFPSYLASGRCLLPPYFPVRQILRKKYKHMLADAHFVMLFYWMFAAVLMKCAYTMPFTFYRKTDENMLLQFNKRNTNTSALVTNGVLLRGMLGITLYFPMLHNMNECFMFLPTYTLQYPLI